MWICAAMRPGGIGPQTPTIAVPLTSLLADQATRSPEAKCLPIRLTVTHTWQLMTQRTEATTTWLPFACARGSI
jgi:hypothetical protein